MSSTQAFQQSEKKRAILHELNPVQSIELTSDELAAIRGGQPAKDANSPGGMGGYIGIGPGIGLGVMSGGINIGVFSLDLGGGAGAAPGGSAAGGSGGGQSPPSSTIMNNNIPGGNISRNNFFTLVG